jgi:hypothetical protein
MSVADALAWRLHASLACLKLKLQRLRLQSTSHTEANTKMDVSVTGMLNEDGIHIDMDHLKKGEVK